MFKINNKNLISLSFIFRLVFYLAIIVLLPQSTKASTCNTWFENGIEYNSCDSYYSESNATNYNSGYNYYNNQANNPVPNISSISPNTVARNSGATITITGYNFIPSSIVKLNGINLYTTFVDSNILRAQLNSYYDINPDSTRFLNVFNPPPRGGYSNAMTLRINSAITISTSTIVTNTKTTNTSSTNNSVKNNTSNNTNTEDEVNTQPVENSSQVKQLAANAIFGQNAFMPSSLIQWIFFFILILLGVIIWRRLYVSEEDKKVPLKHA